MQNLVKQVIQSGGSISPLIIPSDLTNGTGLMNPSIYVDKDKLILNLRHVNYTLYHCENEQLFNNRWGPLVYLNPENDIHLRTTNWLCELNDDLTIKSWNKVDTSKLDVEPVWEFIGLEDGRLVKWDNKLYLCGVRRDTKTNGEGRMELSELKKHKEIKRSRIEPPNDPNSYCEKNWMPVIDMPYHFVKWTNPTEVVKVDPETNTSKTVVLKPQIDSFNNLRGGSQIIPYGDGRICIIHECNLWKNKLEQKDAKYTHRLVMWDKDWNIKHISESFNFMDGEIEFCCGLAEYQGNLLITFGFQDNAAYILKMPITFLDNFIKNNNKKLFDWGLNDQYMINVISSEINEDKNIYEKYVKVKEGDVVFDIGANVGAFTYSILDRNPLKVYCIEPSNTLFNTLIKNTENKCIYINKAISNKTKKTKIEEGVYIYFNKGEEYETITFKELLSEHNINKIDFLKVDCEGGEYDIFTEENKEWILNNVKYIASEWHMSGQKEGANKFRKFRDLYLKDHSNYVIFNQHTGEDLKQKIYDEDYLNHYAQTIVDNGTLIYITNDTNKLKGLKLVNCISLKSSKDRQTKTINEFNKFGTNIKIIQAYDGRVTDYQNNSIVEGLYLRQMDSGAIATVLSHLKAIKDWYNNTNEDYGFFCEDDMLISNANNWSFNWDNVINNLPKDWKAIQLSVIKDIKESDMKLNIRKWDNWACGAYILSRTYVKTIIDKYYPNDKFILINDNLIPLVENIIYGVENKDIYTLPLFTEDISFKSTFYPKFSDTEQKNNQKESADFIKNWWEQNDKTKTIEELCKMN